MFWFRPIRNVKERKTNNKKTPAAVLLNPSASNESWIKALKYTVDRAIKERKIYTVCGNFYSIRQSMTQRGWLEKLYISFNSFDKDRIRMLMEKGIAELVELAKNPVNGYQYKRIIFSKMLSKWRVEDSLNSNWTTYNVFKVRNKCTSFGTTTTNQIY